MVMYTHQFGPRSGGLSVLVAGKTIYPVWERGGSLGDLWVRAEVDFIVNSTFQVSTLEQSMLGTQLLQRVFSLCYISSVQLLMLHS